MQKCAQYRIKYPPKLPRDKDLGETTRSRPSPYPTEPRNPGFIETFRGGLNHGKIPSWLGGGILTPNGMTYSQWRDKDLTLEEWRAQNPGKTKYDYIKWRRKFPQKKRSWFQRILGLRGSPSYRRR